MRDCGVDEIEEIFLNVLGEAADHVGSLAGEAGGSALLHLCEVAPPLADGDGAEGVVVEAGAAAASTRAGVAGLIPASATAGP